MLLVTSFGWGYTNNEVRLCGLVDALLLAAVSLQLFAANCAGVGGACVIGVGALRLRA